MNKQNNLGRRAWNARTLVSSCLVGFALVGSALALSPTPPAIGASNSVVQPTPVPGNAGVMNGVVTGGGAPMTPTPAPSAGDVTPTTIAPDATAEPVATPGAPDPSFSNCTYTISYWKTHPEMWPATSLVLGNTSYSKEQLLDILTKSTGGDATKILAQQLIAAKLNIVHGASDGPIKDTISAAEAWLVANPLGSKPKKPASTTGTGYATTFDKYNNGFLGIPHCGDAAPAPAPAPTSPAAPAPPPPDMNGKKVVLCHSTASASNPYTRNNVSINSVENAISVHGHGDHIGGIYPVDPWGDIIPPFVYENISFPGLNWTEEGRAIWENGCNAPSPNEPPDRFTATCQKGPAVDTATGLACTEGYYKTIYEYRTGAWWTVSTACMTRVQCEEQMGEPPPGSEDDDDDEASLPCMPTLTADGFLLECPPTDKLETWNVHAEVNTSCPINQVTRSPYPRSLVNVETIFTLQPQQYDASNGTAGLPQSPANLSQFVDVAGLPTEDGYESGVWKNLVLYMRSRRFNGGENWFGQTVPRPQWSFADRSWNTDGPYPTYQSGPQATYVYQTSSAGLDTLFGRAFDMVNKVPANTYNLPAYGVSLATFCGYEWKATVQVPSRVWNKSGPCYETRLLPNGKTWTPEGTSNQGCNPGWVSPGSWSYGWQDFATPWTGLDLKQMGRSSSYEVRTHTVSGGTFKGVEYWDQPAGIWVPVLEIQSVLREECVARGTCAPPSAVRQTR